MSCKTRLKSVRWHSKADHWSINVFTTFVQVMSKKQNTVILDFVGGPSAPRSTSSLFSAFILCEKYNVQSLLFVGLPRFLNTRVRSPLRAMMTTATASVSCRWTRWCPHASWVSSLGCRTLHRPVSLHSTVRPLRLVVSLSRHSRVSVCCCTGLAPSSIYYLAAVNDAFKCPKKCRKYSGGFPKICLCLLVSLFVDHGCACWCAWLYLTPTAEQMLSIYLYTRLSWFLVESQKSLLTSFNEVTWLLNYQLLSNSMQLSPRGHRCYWNLRFYMKGVNLGNLWFEC